ncbi:dephospho-CoA kinase [Spiroplasma helicoides]|uniref:Dephospho-CoA kinase n=1 Tax=Spiroplasma helicoides TaxID=216938 RepID=A0A1B3SKQ7_9MOLU|nr:dephospho-CoA kinase [Spiroplasma helicoides]AOG60511.1 dephospho-CoA kinase [Spiroplasma helicoides]
MILFGVGGLIGSGKSTLSKYLKERYNAYLINADLISKKVIYEPKVIEFLNKYIPNFYINGIIDRKKVGDVIFNDYNLNEKFIKIIWPLITEEIKKIIEKVSNEYDYVIVEAAIISGIQLNYNKTIFIERDESKRVLNVHKRDKRNVEQIKKISDYQKRKLENKHFDYIIKNNGNLKDLYKKIDAIFIN